MRKLLSTFILLVGMGAHVSAQSVNIQFTENSKSSSCKDAQYCVDLQVNLIDANSQELGNASVRFNYDPAVLGFSGHTDDVQQGSYTSKSFHPATTCNGQHPYAKHSFDGLIPGDFLISTLLYNPNATECTEKLSKEWTDLATICFDVLDANKSPELTVKGTEGGYVTNLAGTNFNTKSNEPSKKFLNGAFTALEQSFNEVCKVSSADRTNLVGDGWQIVSLQPVPVQDNMVLDLEVSENSDITLQVFDLAGKLVEELDHKVNTGVNSLNIDASQYAPGAYFLSVNKNGEMLAAKFIKK